METPIFMELSDSLIFVANCFNISLLKYKAREKKAQTANCPMYQVT